jgi:26S proteasome regulatory subunit N10
MGIMSMGGKRCDMKVTQTNDVDALMSALNRIDIGGECDVLKSIKVAQLSLKHRMNKNQRQRIVVFVGHPLVGTEEDFEDVGMRLKRNNVNIDVINFSHTDNVSRLQSMVAAANQGQEADPSSHFLDVAPGCNITDVLISSPICMPEDVGGGAAAMGGGAPGGGGLADLGFDPSMDPELAAAIRMSLEE